MTLTVGTDAFATIVTVDAFLAGIGNTLFPALDDADKEVNIRKATNYLQRRYSWRGTPATSTQRLHWPAVGARRDNGYDIATTVIPVEVEEATAIVADLYRAGIIDLEGVITNDAAIKSQKVDVIAVEYDTALRLRGPAILTHVDELVAPVSHAHDDLVRT